MHVVMVHTKVVILPEKWSLNALISVLWQKRQCTLIATMAHFPRPSRQCAGNYVHQGTGTTSRRFSIPKVDGFETGASLTTVDPSTEGSSIQRHLPDEVIIAIFSADFFVENLVQCMLTCKRWNELSHYVVSLKFDCIGTGTEDLSRTQMEAIITTMVLQSKGLKSLYGDIGHLVCSGARCRFHSI